MNLNFYSKATTTLSSLRKSFGFCLVAAILFVNNAQAQTAKALSFDGTNDYVTVPVKPALNVVNAITIEAWIKPTKASGVQDVISKSSATSSNGYIFPRTANGWATIEFLLNINSAGWKTLRVPFGADKLNTWHHVAASYDGYTLRIYIDGALAGSMNFAGTITVNNNNLTLGNQSGLAELYGGSVDDARIFNRALSSCEISNSMNCELSGSENGLIAYYKFNQGLLGLPNPLETSLTDASPTGANGTLVNFGLLGTGLLSNWSDGAPAVSSTICAPVVPTSVTAGALLTTVPVSGTLNLTAVSQPGATYSWTGPNNFTSNEQNPSIEGVGINASGTYTVTATLNGCAGTSSILITVAPRASGLNLDGIDDFVWTGYNPKLNSDAFSVEAWVYPTDANITNQNVVTNSDIYSQTGFKFPKTNDKWNSFSFELSVDNSWKELRADFPTSAINKWNHLAATFDGYFMRIYLNGILVGTQEVTGTYTKSARNLMIGNNDERSEFYKGAVDEVRVWGRAISQCEIINNMRTCELNGDNNGLANQVALTAYYRFNQGLLNANNEAYTSLADSSGNNAHGTLANFALTGLTSNWVTGKVYGICDFFPLPLLTASANGSVFQTGSTAKLFAVYGNNDVYNWEGPNAFATSTQNPVLNNVQEIQAGTYTVSTPYTNCVVTSSTRIKVSDLPQIVAAGPTSFCPSGSVSLSTANPGTAYQWFRDDVAINGATTNTYVATQGGNYSVKVTNGTQIIISAPLLVTVIPDVTAPVANVATLPTINVVAPATVTSVPTATDACRGAINGTTTSPRTFNTSGTYTIVWNYNDGNGNTSTQNQTVVVTRPADVTAPVLTVPANITVAANGTTCNAVVTFAATATEESEDPTVTITYSKNPGTTFPIGTTTVNVTATDAAGNSSTGSFTVTVTASWVAPITGTTTVCAGSSTTLATASTGGTWSSSNQTVASVNATSGVVNGLTAGTTSITYTNSCGVSASTTVTVNAAPGVPTVAAVNNCGSTVLTALNTTGTVNWNNGSTGTSITVSTAGTYSATQTVNGCVSAAASVVAAPKAATATPIVNVVNNCGSSTLTVSNPTGTVTWSNGATTNAITVSNSATYTVTQTANGCPSAAGSGVSAPKAVQATPVITVTNNCGSTTLTSNVSGAWSNGGNGTSITVTTGGSYTVTVTNAGGCSASATSAVTVNTNPAVSSITGSSSVVAGTTTQLSNAVTGGVWSSNSVNATVNASGLVTGVIAGSATITYTVTNGAGCSTSVSTVITVTPAVVTCIAPAIATVSNITINAASTQCAAATTYTASVTGTTPTVTYTFSGATSGNGNGTGSGATFNVGTTTVTIRAVNNCGTVSTSFSVTVKDVTAPVAATKNITVALDADGNATVTPAQVNNGSSDNCGAVTLAFKSSTTTTPVTGTICATADENGTLTLTAPSGATITGINFASYGTPNGTCGNFTINSSCNSTTSKSVVEGYALGKNSVSIPANNDVFGDPCYGTVKRLYVQATYTMGTVTNGGGTVSSLSFDCAKKGANTVTLSVTDASGNTSLQTAVVTVVDNSAPTVTAVPAQTFCGTAGSFTVPALATDDNCAVTSITYAITGATTRSGSTNNASGTFNTGTSTITWTVKDASNNTTTSTTTVIVGGGPVATIAASGTSGDFCSELVLTGSSSVSGASYKWVSGSTVVGTSNQFSLGQNSAEGTYQLYVTANGCTSNAASYTFNKQNLLGSYTILVYDEAKFGKYAKVSTGSVGVMSSWGSVKFQSNTSVNGPNSFVKSPRIDKDGSSINITRQIIGVASVSVPAMQYNTSNANYYSSYSTSQYSTVTLNSNYKNLTVRRGTYATLTGTIFGTIELEEGASVRFTNATVNIDKLIVEDGARDGYYSYVRFAQNSSVRVSTQVSIGSQVLVNPDNNKVTFYMGDGRCDTEKFTVRGADTKVIANIIMPNGKLKVTSTDSEDDNHGNCSHGAHSSWNCGHRGHNHRDCDHRGHNNDDCNDDVYMTGTFIVEDLESKGNTVIWNSYQCGSTPVAVTVVNKSVSTVATQAVTSENTTATSEEELKITVMPNPSTTYFTLKFESKYDAPINMRVMDANGRVVDAQSKIGSNSTIRVGASYASGTYYAEMIQGGTRKVIQLIKVKG